MHHRHYSVLAMALLASFVGRASGTLRFYDSFNYGPSGTSLSTASSPTWQKNQSSADPTVQDVGGLTYPGLKVSSDTVSVQYDGTGPGATDGHNISSTGIATGSLYYSLLLKVTDVGTTSGFSTAGNLTGGSYMAGLQTVAGNAATNAGTTAAPLLIRSGDGTQFSTTYQLGTGKTAATANRQWYTSQTYTTGANAETVFVVLKYTFDGTNPNNDIAQLFIDPTPGDPEPAAQVTQTGGTANLTLNSGIKSFFIRNNSVEPDTMLIDELRIGDTWEDVTPAVPEPATVALVLVGLCMTLCLRRRGG
jgi:hypothetical protein